MRPSEKLQIADFEIEEGVCEQSIFLEEWERLFPEMEDVTLSFDVEATEILQSFSKTQKKAYDMVMENFVDLIDVIFEKLFAKYDAYLEMYQEDMPKIEKPADFYQYATPNMIQIYDLEKNGNPYIGIGFHCSWDVEHAFGAILCGTEVVDIGGADTAILLWIAKQHADCVDTKTWTKEELLAQIDVWYDAEEHQKIVNGILNFPEEKQDDALLGQLAVAYNNTQEYEKAIAVLQKIKKNCENTYKWQYRMGYALYYRKKYEKAEQAFSKSLKLNPSKNIAEDCHMFLTWCKEEREEMEHMGDYYTEAEMECVEKHITKHFGEFEGVLHELVSPDLHIDICVVPPSKQRNYYTLVTMGMGAYAMHVPKELKESKLERAEVCICLPPDWKIDSDDETWYWPIRCLKTVARLPKMEQTWFGWGHTISNGVPYAENTTFTSSILLSPQALGSEAQVCVLPNGDDVNFYQLIPLYDNELSYKINHGAEELLDKMAEIGVSHVVDITRENACRDMSAPSLAENLHYWHVSGQYENIVDKLLSLPPKELNYDLTCQLARAYNNLERYDDAIKYLEAVKQMGRNDELWHYRIGYAYYYKDGDIAEQLEYKKQAYVAFQEVLRLNPNDEDAVAFCEICEKTIAFFTQLLQPTEKFIEKKINRLHNQNDHAEIEQLIEDMPMTEQNYDILCYLARAKNNMGKYQEALQILQLVNIMGRKDAMWAYRVAFALYHSKHYEVALKAIQEAAKLDNENEDIQILLAACKEKVLEEIQMEEQYTKDMPVFADVEALKEQIQPFFWVEGKSSYSVCLTVGTYLQDVFDLRAEEGFEGNGYDWTSLATVFLEECCRELENCIAFDPEADMFCAYAEDPKALRKFITEFQKVCQNKQKITALFLEAELD